MANRQVANSAWLAELSKIAANRVTTYNSTSTTIPAIAKICLEVIFVFLFCVSLSCDICIPFVITIHNHKRAGVPVRFVDVKRAEVPVRFVDLKRAGVPVRFVDVKRAEVPELSVCPRDCGTVRVIRDSQRSRHCVPYVLRWVLESSSVP